MATSQQTERQPEQRIEIDDRYDTDVPVWSDTVEGAALAWLQMGYPLADRSKHPPGVLRAGSESKLFHQHPDGTGRVGHGSETCAVRLPDGTVLLNTTCDPEPRGMHAHQPILSASRGMPEGETPDVIRNVPFEWVDLLASRETDLDVSSDESFFDGVYTADELRRWDIEDSVDSAIIVLNHESGWDLVLGSDPTAHRQFRRFGFVVSPETDVETPRDALDIIRPPEVSRAMRVDGKAVKRHGEWFVIPTADEPAGSMQKPGVAERPFGGSPMDNHIPREWATAVEDDVFVSRFLDRVDLVNDVDGPEAPQDVADLVYDHTQGEDVFEPHVDLTYPDLWAMAETIYVRGSLRHREVEHLLIKFGGEDYGGGWHKAVTHDHQVYTADSDYQTLTAD